MYQERRVWVVEKSHKTQMFMSLVEVTEKGHASLSRNEQAVKPHIEIRLGGNKY